MTLSFPQTFTKLNKWVLFVGLLYTASIKFISVENFTSVDMCSKEYLLRFSSSTPKASYTWFLKFPLLQMSHIGLSLFARKWGIHNVFSSTLWRHSRPLDIASLSFCPNDSGPSRVPKILGIWTTLWSTLLSSSVGREIEGWGHGRRRWAAGPLASALLRGFVSQGNRIRV